MYYINVTIDGIDYTFGFDGVEDFARPEPPA